MRAESDRDPHSPGGNLAAGRPVGLADGVFIGWFGPRGLASIVFALLALEDLHGVPGPIGQVVATIGLTVLLSVVFHGLTAQPLAKRYAATQQADQEPAEHPEPTLRRFVSPSRKAF